MLLAVDPLLHLAPVLSCAESAGDLPGDLVLMSGSSAAASYPRRREVVDKTLTFKRLYLEEEKN